MSDFFKQIALNPKKMGEKLLGPDYPYQDNIRTPSELGMSSEGSMKAMANNVSSLMNYTRFLIEGTGPASVTNKPLGNKYFMKTGAKCKDPKGKLDDRYIYINNIASGTLPFLKNVTTSQKGLIPGILENIADINPFAAFGGFSEEAEPPCTRVCMPTMSIANVAGEECRHLTNTDIEAINPCSFPKKNNVRINPLNGKKCREMFIGNKMPKYSVTNLTNKPFANAYLFGFSLFLLYLVYKVQNKR